MRRVLVSIFVLAVAGIVATAAIFFGQHYSADRAEATLVLVRTEGMARLGYAEHAPLAYGDSGGLTGEAPEIARVVLERMGVERVQGVLTRPGSLVSELYARRFEIIASGLPITQRRCARVVFSDPTHVISEGFLVRQGNPLKLHSYADAATNPEAHIGVVSGSQQHTFAVRAGIPASRIRVITSPGAGVATLVSGVIDAFAADALTVQQIVDQSPDAPVERSLPFEGPVVDGHEVKRYAAFAFRKEDTGLAREFNLHLKDFIGTPEHLALVRPFGITQADLPPEGLSAEVLCKRELSRSAALASSSR